MEEDGKIAFTVVYVTLFLAAFVGNVLVIFVVLRRPGMKSPTNLLLVNMAVADLLFALFVYPLALTRYHVRGLWIGGSFGEFSCHAMFFMSHLPIAGSTTTLIFIALERFFAIKFPHKVIKIFRKVWIITLVIWLSSAVLMMPVGIAANTAEKNGKTYCDRDWSVFGDPAKAIRTFYDATFVVTYAAPLLFMAILYAVICHKLWRHHPPGCLTAHAQHNSMLHKRQVVRMLITVVVVFALCWLPTHVQHFLITYFPKVHADFSFVTMVTMNLIGHTNPAINPCLLVGLNIRYRNEFFRLFRGARVRVVPTDTPPRPAENMPELGTRETGTTSSLVISTQGLRCLPVANPWKIIGWLLLEPSMTEMKLYWTLPWVDHTVINANYVKNSNLTLSVKRWLEPYSFRIYSQRNISWLYHSRLECQ